MSKRQSAKAFHVLDHDIHEAVLKNKQFETAVNLRLAPEEIVLALAYIPDSDGISDANMRIALEVIKLCDRNES